MIGQKLLHYQILEKLGEGGMGAVYKARDTHLNRFVAVKVLTRGQISTTEQRQRFINEARAASALNHPNIVHIYDIGYDGGVDFIAMEFVSGKTVAELIRRKSLTLPKALRYAIQVADALNKAHGAGIVHRDLKPSNVMVNDDGVVKLLDFGLAKLVELPGSSDNLATMTAGDIMTPTQEGVIVGTAAYMAPEQAECKPIDARADVFSFGALLYEMVSGQRAFPGDSQATMLVAIMTKEPPPLKEVPRSVEKVIHHCLRKNPLERWHSMADVKMALEDLHVEYSTGSGELKRIVAPRRPMALLAGLGVLLLLLAVGVVLLLPKIGPVNYPTDLNPRPLTTYEGYERYPTISPDGSQVAFSWNGAKPDNYGDIYVQHINSGTIIRLTDDQAEEDHPSWSPDGRYIAFHRHFNQHHAGVFIVSPLGGPVKSVWDADLSAGLSWTPDGKWLLLSVLHTEGENPGIFLLSVETRERRRLTAPPAGGAYDTDAVISPDGRKLAFVRGSTTFVSGLYVVDLNKKYEPLGGAKQLPLPPQWYCASPVWTPDSKNIVFSGGTEGCHSLWRVQATGTRPPQRLSWAGDVGRAELTISRPTPSSPSRLVYSRRLDDSNIWLLNLKDPANAPRSLISSTRNDLNPRYSPDGSSIAFESARLGNVELWVSSADGQQQRPLTSLAAYSGSPAWSPDGKRIAYESNAGGHWNIYTVGVGGENPQQLTKGPEIDSAPSWSRDGKWIYYAVRAIGPYRIWKMPSDGGEAVAVTKGPGYMAMETTDGKSLIYSRDGGNPTSIWKLDLETGTETQLAAPVVRDSLVVVKDGIYYVARGSPKTLKFLDFTTGEAKTLRSFDRTPISRIDVSPDGGQLLFSQNDQSGSDLMVVDNFR